MAVDTHDITRLQTMDESAWAGLQEDYFRRVYFFVKRYVNNHQTAEDLTQDVFVGAVKGIKNFDTAYTLDQFVFGIAKNRVIDHYRKHKLPLLSPKKESDSDASMLWIENLPEPDCAAPPEDVVTKENALRRREVLGRILKEFVAELWQSKEFLKLQVLEYLFVLGGAQQGCRHPIRHQRREGHRWHQVQGR